MVRGIDHLVVAVRDLDAAAAHWTSLGFTVTPEAHHPWGTANRLVQLDGFFVELLTVADPSRIVEAGEGEFSFGAFNRDFLKTREGGSMLVLESADPAGDRAAFRNAGLPVFAPFSFERIAKGPDGTDKKVAFDLTFTSDQAAPEIGFFTCHNKYPENFWKAAYKSHENGVTALRRIIIVAEEPAEHHEFLEAFAGSRELRASSLGIELDTPRGTISIFSPAAFRSLYGTDAASSLPASRPVIAAIEFGNGKDTARKVFPGSEVGGLSVILPGA